MCLMKVAPFVGISLFEPARDKTYKMACAPSENLDTFSDVASHIITKIVYNVELRRDTKVILLLIHNASLTLCLLSSSKTRDKPEH